MKKDLKKNIKIGDFRNHFSSYLKEIRQGKELVICDREEPIAKIIPFKKNTKSSIRPAQVKGALKHIKPQGIKAQVDVVAILRELRGNR